MHARSAGDGDSRSISTERRRIHACQSARVDLSVVVHADCSLFWLSGLSLVPSYAFAAASASDGLGMRPGLGGAPSGSRFSSISSAASREGGATAAPVGAAAAPPLR